MCDINIVLTIRLFSLFQDYTFPRITNALWFLLITIMCEDLYSWNSQGTDFLHINTKLTFILFIAIICHINLEISYADRFNQRLCFKEHYIVLSSLLFILFLTNSLWFSWSFHHRSVRWCWQHYIRIHWFTDHAYDNHHDCGVIYGCYCMYRSGCRI